jgi:hypothetical protein
MGLEQLVFPTSTLAPDVSQPSPDFPTSFFDPGSLDNERTNTLESWVFVALWSLPVLASYLPFVGFRGPIPKRFRLRLYPQVLILPFLG